MSTETTELRFPKTIEQLDSAVFKRYYDFKKEFNNAQELGSKAFLKGGHLNMFQSIMYKYLPHFRYMVNSPIWADSDEVPALYTTRRELSLLNHCSPRTAYNLLARLAEANIITVEETTEGKRVGYTIRPNLYFVLGQAELKPQVESSKTAVTVLRKSLERQILPDINNLKILSNKRKAEDELLDPKDNTNELYQRKEQTKPLGGISNIIGALNFEETEENTKEISGGPAENVDNSVENQRVVSKRDKFFGKSGKSATGTSGNGYKAKIQPVTHREKIRIVNDFYEKALEKLFKGRIAQDEFKHEMKKTIYTDVFGGFEGNQDFNEWQVFALMREAEIDMMVKHNEKYNRVAFFSPKYFSKGYMEKGGFLSMHKWVAKERTKYTELHHAEMLKEAKEALVLGIIPKAQQDKIQNMQDLAQYWKTRLARQTGNKEIVNEFLIFVNNQNPIRKWDNSQTTI